MKDTLPNLQFLYSYKQEKCKSGTAFLFFPIMPQHQLLALQGFKGTTLLIQLSLVNFMECILSEDMTKNIIQWQYFASKETQAFKVHYKHQTDGVCR